MGSDTTCDVTFQTEERVHAYLAEVENFTVTIQHSMRTPEIIQEVDMKDHGLGLLVCDENLLNELSGEGRRLKAAVEHSKGKTCGFVQPDKSLNSMEDGPDAFRLDTLLKVAGIDLDEPSSAQTRDSNRRLKGTTLVLTIHYMNTKPWKSFYKAFFEKLPIEYYYHLDELPVDEYKIRDSYWRNGWNNVQRTVVEVNGIRFLVLFSGKLGVGSVVALLTMMSVSFTTLMMAESLVVYFIRFSPITWVSGKVKQAHLAESFADNSRDITEGWEDTFNKRKAEGDREDAK